jgi:hypothetical protein
LLSAAVPDFIPRQNEEMRAAIDRRVRESGRSFRVIPVLLPGAERSERSSLPTFLAATTRVEFRDSLDDQDAFHRLVCGIRGMEPGSAPAKPFTKVSVHIEVYAFSTWTMPPFSSVSTKVTLF